MSKDWIYSNLHDLCVHPWVTVSQPYNKKKEISRAIATLKLNKCDSDMDSNSWKGKF